MSWLPVIYLDLYVLGIKNKKSKYSQVIENDVIVGIKLINNLADIKNKMLSGNKYSK